jgi:hypothetical protein
MTLDACKHRKTTHTFKSVVYFDFVLFLGKSREARVLVKDGKACVDPGALPHLLETFVSLTATLKKTLTCIIDLAIANYMLEMSKTPRLVQSSRTAENNAKVHNMESYKVMDVRNLLF